MIIYTYINMKKNHLTKKQERVLTLINNYFRNNGQSPKISELREMLGVRSLRTVTQYLEILERKGFIYRDKHSKRGIRIFSQKKDIDSQVVTMPVFASAGCDNQTILAEPIHDEYISVSQNFLGDKIDKLVAIRAIGDSMIEAGINNGDTVLVEKTDQVKNGDMTVAIIDDIAIIKRVFFTDNAVILNPASKDKSYKPIIMRRDFKIFGKVIDIVKKPENNDEVEIIPIKDY
jgi:repressor LexA